ncbi:MAG: hypothetical protein P8N07_12470 [Flavobacteriales bacterium]|jgi:hypothetical protein|nr:hypothetical protein [Flavobacteriales bacterium]
MNFNLIKSMFGFIIISIITSCTKGYIPEDIEPPTNIASDTITYDSHINNIVSLNCRGCHSGTNPQGNLLLENYNQVRNSAETGTLIQRINDVPNPMPTTGLMPTQTRSIFDSWVNNGFLEN